MHINPGYIINKMFRLLNRPALRNCTIDKTSKIGTGSNCIDVVMARYSYMGKNNSVANTKIGAFCSIASYCAIGGGAHSIDMVSTSPVFHSGRNILRKNFATNSNEINKPVIIGNDVWIGEGVFVKDGITIGNGAIVGAHSVVTKDVPPYAIVAGAPATLIRYRFSEDEIRCLLEIKWWEWPDEKILSSGHLFNSVKDFIGEFQQ